MNAVLKLKQAKPNDQQVKASFKNVEGIEVKEMIRTSHSGDENELLIDLEKELIRLRNHYDLFKDGKWKPLMQLWGRALGGCIKHYWSEIIEGATIAQTRTAASHLSKFKKSIQKVNVKYLRRDNANIQCDTMLMGKLLYKGQDPKKAIERLFEINNGTELFSEEAEGFPICKMARKIIPQTLKPLARLKYFNKGGMQLHKREDIFKLCRTILVSVRVRVRVRHQAVEKMCICVNAICEKVFLVCSTYNNACISGFCCQMSEKIYLVDDQDVLCKIGRVNFWKAFIV